MPAIRRQRQHTTRFTPYKPFKVTGRKPDSAGVNPGPVSDQQVTKMRYAQSDALNGNIVNSTVFRMNSIFDPYSSGVGHQPYGHDQWNNFYGNYEVYACGIKVHFANNTTQPVQCTLLPSNNSSVSSGNTLSVEKPYSKTVVCGGGTSGDNKTSLSHFMTVAKALGTKGRQTDRSAAFGANPAEQSFWHILVANMDGTNLSDVDILVELTYYVRMYDRLPLAES